MKRVILILLLMQGVAHAGGSIFGAYPAGDAQQVSGVRSIGLGGAGLALWDSLGFHGENAAQLGAITGTTLRIGATAGLWNTTSGGMTDTDSEYGWQSFRLVFAPHKRYHTGIGIDPIRRSDIRMFESTSGEFLTDTGWVSEPYERRTAWEGGAADLRWDNALNLTPKIAVGVTVGFEIDYLQVTENLDFPTPESGSGARDAEFKETQRFTGYWGGVSLSARPSEKFSFGAYWRSDARGRFHTEQTVNNTGDGVTTQEDGTRPGKFGFGIGYSWHRAWSTYADANMQAWKTEQFGPLYAWAEDVTSTSISVGIEKKGGVLATQEGFDRWDYRAGLTYKVLPYEVTKGGGAAETVKEVGLAAGVSIPLAQRSGKVHLALEGGLRGMGQMTEENFVRVHAHIDVHELWFQRVRRTVK